MHINDSFLDHILVLPIVKLIFTDNHERELLFSHNNSLQLLL
jgi:hypothetical protein